MKKIFALFLVVLILATLGACRQKSTTTENEETTNTEEADENEETSMSETTVTIVDVDANEQPFVQTGKTDEDITITQTGADKATVVVDLGELVTLNVYSERLKPTQLYNKDLHVDTLINRGETVTVTIEANEEGIFYFTDASTDQTLFKFMIAGTSFG
jgi:predicted small lipoprotein YifL